MTPEAQRIAIAEAYPSVIRFNQANQHWEWSNGIAWLWCHDNDPLQDLNAMHEAEKTLQPDERESFVRYLMGSLGGPSSFYWMTAHSTAAQRAEAFLRTLNLWKD